MPASTARSHTTNAALVASKVARIADARLAPEDLPLDRDARAVWCDVTGGDATDARGDGLLQHPVLEPVRNVLCRLRRADERSDPLVLAARLIVRMAAARVPEWRLRKLPLFLEQVIEACYSGKARRSVADIDRDEQRLEARETELTLERRITEAEGREVTEDALLEEAAINESEAAIQLERARALRHQARMLAFRRPIVRVAAS